MNTFFVKAKWLIFYFSARFHLPKLTARLFSRCLGCTINRPNNESLIRILTLSGPNFNEDVLSSLGDDERFEILSFDEIRKVFKAMAKAFLPSRVNDYNYCSRETDIEDGKESYRYFLREFWRELQKYVRISAVVSGNFGYYAERELAAELENLGTPFIVLHKENFKSPGRVEYFKEVYRKGRGTFQGRKILVYNEIEQQLQIESGIVRPQKVDIVGMPRLDRIHRWRMSMNRRRNCGYKDKDQILVFSFGEKTGLPRGIPEELLKGQSVSVSDKLSILGWWKEEFEKLGWWKLVQSYHKSVIKAARLNPGTRFIIKTKNIPPESASMEKIIANEFSLPKNMEIVKGGNALNYILESRLVCGFNTTGLIEAIAANKPVIVPNFDEANEELLQPYIVDMEDTVSYAGSPEELTRLLATIEPVEDVDFTNNNLSDPRLRLIKSWAGNIDGKSGQRVRDAILNEIGQKE